MSKKLEKQATRLVRKAENRALAIRLVVRDYRDATQNSEGGDIAGESERHREIETAVAKYNEANKALRRIGKKLHLKNKDNRGPARRAFRGR